MKNKETKISIHFLGAAGTVTGSKYLVKALGKNILVDCGLFQGIKALRKLNWDYLPINIDEVDVVLLTHGHLDHTGYLPRLIKGGFKGKIMATLPTLEVAKIILYDSARIQEEEAERANEEGYSKHKPAIPLYDTKDVEHTVSHFSPQPLKHWVELYENIQVRYRYNGHILGATSIELKIKDKVLVFSGDIGREEDLLMYPPDKPEQADVVFIESTYGNKLHPGNSEERLAMIINSSFEKNGTIIIPSFAVERTQLLMYILWQLREKKLIPVIPIYLDSPMGANVLELFQQFTEWHKLSVKDCEKMCKDIVIVKTQQDSIKLASQEHSKIIIAGSGMASGGRVLSYFQHYLEDPSATVLLVGYQAEGTRGRKMLDGAKEIRLYGKYYPVKAKIENLEGLSAHADQVELISWLSRLQYQPSKIFIVHGEKEGSEGLFKKIREHYGWEAEIPKLYDLVELTLDKMETFNATNKDGEIIFK